MSDAPGLEFLNVDLEIASRANLDTVAALGAVLAVTVYRRPAEDRATTDRPGR